MTLWEGITENGWQVKIALQGVSLSQQGNTLQIKGKILPIKITGFEENYLVGEITSLPTN